MVSGRSISHAASTFRRRARATQPAIPAAVRAAWHRICDDWPPRHLHEAFAAHGW